MVLNKNRDRLIEGQIAEAFMHEVRKAGDARSLLSHKHFTVDFTLLEAWASSGASGRRTIRHHRRPPAAPRIRPSTFDAISDAT